MHFQAIVGVLVAVLSISVTADPGLLHDEPHHTHEVLDNIHETPHCAYACYFSEDYQKRFAGKCLKIDDGKMRGACFCRSDAYQYIVDQCYSRKCKRGERKKAREMNEKSCEHYGVKKEEMYAVEDLKKDDD